MPQMVVEVNSMTSELRAMNGEVGAMNAKMYALPVMAAGMDSTMGRRGRMFPWSW
jgi:hypothetical protein